MPPFACTVFALCISIASFHASGYMLEITISQKNGNDLSNCTQSPLTPCKSINFTLEEIWKDEQVKNVHIFFEEDYLFNETVFVKESHKSLQSILWRGETNRTSITFAKGKNIRLGHMEEFLGIVLDFRNISFVNASDVLAALVIENMENASFYNCLFEYNCDSSILLTNTNVVMDHCRFIGKDYIDSKKNTISQGILEGDGNAPLKHFASRGIVLVYRERNHHKAVLTHCSFKGLQVLPLEKGDATLSSAVLQSSGGAILISLEEESNENVIVIDRCTFLSQRAEFGGAIAMLGKSSSSLGLLIINNSVFTSCRARCAGGAIFVSSSELTVLPRHSVHITMTTIENCSATLGGAIRVELYNNNYDSAHFRTPWDTRLLIITSSHLIGNEAVQGGALHVSCLNKFWNCGSKYPIYLENITISKQRRLTEDRTSSLSGAIYFEMIRSIFNGTNMISNSKDMSGVVLINSEIRLIGNLTLFGNFAGTKGGGIVFSGFSHVFLERQAHMVLEKNFAWIEGGGMYVLTSLGMLTSHIANPRCFILQETDEKIQVDFIKNGARISGGAMFADTLTHCGSSYHFPLTSPKTALMWVKKTFRFKDNYISSYYGSGNISFITTTGFSPADVATSTFQFNLTDKEVYASPGENVKLNIRAFDEIGFQAYSLSTVYIWEESSHTLISDNISIIVHDDHMVMSQRDSVNTTLFAYDIQPDHSYGNFTGKSYRIFIVDDNSPSLAMANFDLIPVKCKVGYIFDKTIKQCICNVNDAAILRYVSKEDACTVIIIIIIIYSEIR